MATYKVIQDIEAEDKFVGPLTIKQFAFAGFTVLCLYIDFLLLQKGLWPGLFFVTPPAIIAGFLAFPWGRDQPTEVWLLAKFRYFFKPRKRIWDQSGIKELVTITVPKHIEKNLTNGLGEEEVQSRLKALANTIDSRGWIIKNVDVNLFQQPSYINAGQTNSDRLIDVSALPQSVPATDISSTDDILDETNPVAHQLEAMIDASTESYHNQLVERLKARGEHCTSTSCFGSTGHHHNCRRRTSFATTSSC
jgi:PrgI family protein